MTQKARFKTLENDSVEVSVKFREVLKAQANLEIKLETTKWGGEKVESKVAADVVARFIAAPINLIELSPNHADDTLPIDLFALEDTPIVVFADGQTNVLYKEGDDLSNLDIEVPVTALNEKGEIVEVDYPSVRFNDQNWTGGSFSSIAPMENGLALVPVKLKITNPATFSINIDSVVVRTDLPTNGNGVTVGARPQAILLVLFAIPITIEALSIATAATVATISAVACAVNQSCVSNMTEMADELLKSGRAVPVVTPSVALPANGVCRAAATAAPVIRRTRNRPLAPIASPARCVPKPDQSAGSSSVPSQTRFNENEAKPSNLDYQAQQGIWDKFLQEADLFCRFGRGTFDKFTDAQKQILIEAGKLWKGGTGASRESVLEFLKRKKLIGKNGKFTGHHQNSKACYPSLARDITNLTIVESAAKVHRDVCHGGKYGNCTFGELFKETADIITDWISQGIPDDPLGVCR